jgi:hypothetical protein
LFSLLFLFSFFSLPPSHARSKQFTKTIFPIGIDEVRETVEEAQPNVLVSAFIRDD